MMRKGEMTAAAIDRTWPYQVALASDECSGASYDVVHGFCRDLSLAPRGHAVFRDGQWFNVFCFSVEADAQNFRERFNGIPFDPRMRGRGGNWNQWKA